MKTFNKPHHHYILEALNQFDAIFFHDHQIMFGGGTRIALELNEYRESIDIDFICPNKQAFRAVRLQISEYSLGLLVKQDFIYPRAIRADREAVRCFIEIEGVRIKLEFVSFADYELEIDPSQPFVVPALSRTSCYMTKLLANADRYNDPPYKDIFDLLAMYDHWGKIPQKAWQQADKHYGISVVLKNLYKACELIEAQPTKYLDIAQQLDIETNYASQLIHDIRQQFITDLIANEQTVLSQIQI